LPTVNRPGQPASYPHERGETRTRQPLVVVLTVEQYEAQVLAREDIGGGLKAMMIKNYRKKYAS
jgi:hypothetical protein